MRRVALTGASGLIGSALTAALHARGDTVIALPRKVEREASDFAEVDAVVNLAGAGVGDRRWTSAYRREIRDSRVLGTRSLARALSLNERTIRLISASAVGYYGDRGDEVLTEASAPGSGFLAGACREWENAADVANAVFLRTGIVLSSNGGALAKLLPLARIGLAGPLGSGQQYWPWITLHDHVRAVLWLLDHPEIVGPVNVTGPQPARQAELARELGKALRRPAVLPVPGFALRLGLGGFAEELLHSQYALPEVLTRSGFEFDHAEMSAAARWAIGSRR